MIKTLLSISALSTTQSALATTVSNLYIGTPAPSTQVSTNNFIDGENRAEILKQPGFEDASENDNPVFMALKSKVRIVVRTEKVEGSTDEKEKVMEAL